MHEAGFDTSPETNAELLLLEAAGQNRTHLYLNIRSQLQPVVVELYDSFIKRRLAGEPVQYITGWAPFYGRRFRVGRGCFIPRFDSERIVERAIASLEEIWRSRISAEEGQVMPLRILDLCCGCGAFGLTIAAEIDGVLATLVDFESIPLEYAYGNACNLNLLDRISIERMDVMKEFPPVWREEFDLVIANPPYIPVLGLANLPIDVKSAEPYSALTDGGDGLSFYRRWSETVPPLLREGGWFITETGDNAADSVIEILSSGFSDLNAIPDLSGNRRAVEGAKSFKPRI